MSQTFSQISFGGGFATPEPEENLCTTPHGKEGKCIGLRNCNNIIVLLKKPIPTEVIKYLRSSVCSFSGFLPDVCCPEQPVSFNTQEIISTTTTTTTSTTTTTTTTTTTPSTTSTPPPAINGKWGGWGPWSTCSKTCGLGEKSRTRACNSPAPKNGGKSCEGTDVDKDECNLKECPSAVEIPDECGEKKFQEIRIVNGRPAKLGAWPWQVAIGYKNPDEDKLDYLCGAALITKRHVVTAAHCMRDDLATVLLGEHVLHNDTDGAQPEEFKVMKKIPHPQYNSRTFANDIALLTMESDVVFKDAIQPICLPGRTPELLNEDFVKINGLPTGVYITGWGATSFRGPTSNTLLQGLIQVTTPQFCADKFKAFTNVDIDDTKICARDVNDKIDACQGDSGGPMMWSGRDKKDGKFRFYLLGVVSFGYRCAVKGFPGVYSRVTEYDQWIRDTIANEFI